MYGIAGGGLRQSPSAISPRPIRSNAFHWPEWTEGIAGTGRSSDNKRAGPFDELHVADSRWSGRIDDAAHLMFFRIGSKPSWQQHCSPRDPWIIGFIPVKIDKRNNGKYCQEVFEGHQADRQSYD